MRNKADFTNKYNEEHKVTFYPISVEEFFSCGRYDINPFQRKYVWNSKKASRFIESILSNLPTQSIITYYDYKNLKESVIDGFQRLESLRSFIDNKIVLKNNANLNGLKYSDLPENLQDRIKSYILNLTFIENINDDFILKVYERINNLYENSKVKKVLFSDNKGLKDIVDEILAYKEFQKVFNKINYEEKAEFIIRFLALYENFDLYKGNMNAFLESYITQNEFTSERKNKLVLTFKDTLDKCIVIFKEDVFRNCIHYQTSKGIKNIMYKSISKPVFEMQMLGVADLDFAQIYRNASMLKEQYEQMLDCDDNFRPYYKKMSRRAVEYRIKLWRKIVEDIIKY